MFVLVYTITESVDCVMTLYIDTISSLRTNIEKGRLRKG